MYCERIIWDAGKAEICVGEGSLDKQISRNKAGLLLAMYKGSFGLVPRFAADGARSTRVVDVRVVFCLTYELLV